VCPDCKHSLASHPAASQGALLQPDQHTCPHPKAVRSCVAVDIFLFGSHEASRACRRSFFEYLLHPAWTDACGDVMVRNTSCNSRVAADHDNVKVSTAVFTVLFSRIFALNVLLHVPYLGKASNEFTARCSSLPNQDQCPSWEISLSLPRYSHDPLLAGSNIKMICRSRDSGITTHLTTVSVRPGCSSSPSSQLVQGAKLQKQKLHVKVSTGVYTVLFSCAIAGVCQLCTPFVEACSSPAVKPAMMPELRTAAWTTNRWIHGTSTTMPQCCQTFPG